MSRRATAIWVSVIGAAVLSLSAGAAEKKALEIGNASDFFASTTSQGTAAKGIIGTGPQGIIGTGKAAEGIIGTGPQGIIGTGKAAQGIIGTGRS